MKQLHTVIIDDEPDSIELLQLQLQKNCPQVKVIATYTNPLQALKDIHHFTPDLLFLDIEMPVINGFEILEKMQEKDMSVIFVTAYNQFALKAFKFNALDYLVKPFDTDELTDAVAKAERLNKPTKHQLANLQQQLYGEPISRIAIPGQHGAFFIEFNDIIYVEASNNYSIIVLQDDRRFTISKTLKDVQEVLEERHFLRVHRQYIINLNSLKQFNRNENTLVMNNGSVIPIARNQKERLIEKYGSL